MSTADKHETETLPDVDITKTASDASSHGEQVDDVELTVAPVAAKASKPKRRKKLILVCSIAVPLVVVALVTTIVLLTKGRASNESSTQQGGLHGSGEDILVPPENEDDQKDHEEQAGGREDDQSNAESAGDKDNGGDVVVETRSADWTTTENALPPDEADEEVFPLLSLGNFNGLGSAIAIEMEDTPAKIYFGDPETGCVTVLKQVGGWSLPDMWVWNETDIRGPPPTPKWEQVGEAICEGAGFGTHVAQAIDFVDWDDFDFPESNTEAWKDLISEYENGGTCFVASNPNDGTASIYSYDLNELAWALRQTIKSPEGYNLRSLQAEENFLTISYSAQTEFPMVTDALVHVYQAAPDVEAYERVGKSATFVGRDIDIDSSGHVATLGSDRAVRAYYSNGAASYYEVGKPFEPAMVLNDAAPFEEDLKVVKIDAVDVIVTASIVDAGANGKKTIGIGSYHYIDPNWNADPCFGTSYYPERCGELVTDIWDPGYHGAAEFEPVSADAPTEVILNPRGTAAAVATKTGFSVFSPFNVPFPVDYVLEFDSDTYVSHEIVYISSWGLLSVLVEFADSSSTIQSYMMAGV